MVANIGPADWNYDETLSTLRYANRYLPACSHTQPSSCCCLRKAALTAVAGHSATPSAAAVNTCHYLCTITMCLRQQHSTPMPASCWSRRSGLASQVDGSCAEYSRHPGVLFPCCRAKNITNKPRINEDPKDAMLREFQDEISKLKAALAVRGWLPASRRSHAITCMFAQGPLVVWVHLASDGDSTVVALPEARLSLWGRCGFD
jgi:hypothetical protein